MDRARACRNLEPDPEPGTSLDGTCFPFPLYSLNLTQRLSVALSGEDRHVHGHARAQPRVGRARHQVRVDGGVHKDGSRKARVLQLVEDTKTLPIVQKNILKFELASRLVCSYHCSLTSLFYQSLRVDDEHTKLANTLGLRETQFHGLSVVEAESHEKVLEVRRKDFDEPITTLNSLCRRRL